MGERRDGIAVLHVDDDPSFSTLVKTVLERERESLTVIRAESAIAGLDALDRESIDCVVSDYGMPDVDGLDFFERVRERDPSLPFILLTGEESEEVASEAISAGVTDYVRKGGGNEQLRVLGMRIERAVDRRRTERALAETERKHDTLVRNLPGFVYRCRNEPGWPMEYVSEGVEALTGYDAASIESGAIAYGDLIVEEDAEKAWDAVQRAVENDEPFELVYQIDRRDGDRRWFWEQGRGVREGDTLVALEGFITDVTERQRTTRRLRETNAKIEALHDVASRVDTADGEEAICSIVVEAAEAILEFDTCYVGAVRDGQIVPQATNSPRLSTGPAIMSIDEGVAGKSVRTGETIVVEDAGEDEDAEPVDDEFRSALTIPIEGYGVFQAVSADVGGFSRTDRELADLLVAHLEQALRREEYERVLREERDRFAALFENVPDAAVQFEFVDGEAIVTAVNPAFERVFGADASAVRGRSVNRLFGSAGDGSLADALDREDSLEVELPAASGTQPFLLSTASIDADATGPGRRGYAIYTDISAIRRRERQLAKQNERLEQFASIVSHDLRNPLNVARGHVEGVRDGADPREHAAEALESLDRMETLIGELLALARQGQTVSDPEPVDLAAVVRSAWETVETSESTLQCGDLGVVAGDENRLRRLFENLFRNAIEHGTGRDADGVAAVGVEVGRSEADGGFYVADDGPGIPPDERESVFEFGYTNARSGTGYGLSIVQRVAEAHGWTVRIADADGARFEFGDVEWTSR